MSMSSGEFAALQARMKRRREGPNLRRSCPPSNEMGTAALALEIGAPPNKYGAKRTLYNGRTYDSKAEATMAARLDLRVLAGNLASWRPQVTVRVNWPGTEQQVLRCRLDFELTHPDGRVTFLEVKGYRVRDWALRLRILKLAGIPIEVEQVR